MPMHGSATRCIHRYRPLLYDRLTCNSLLLDAIARRGRTEREKNPTILLASHYRIRLNVLCPFAGFQIGFACAAHIVARPIRFGQQGRLQRRSLFLVLLRPVRAEATNRRDI
jgi:hypothetical protein